MFLYSDHRKYRTYKKPSYSLKATMVIIRLSLSATENYIEVYYMPWDHKDCIVFLESVDAFFEGRFLFKLLVMGL